MEIKEVKQDLFGLDEKYALAHCMSYDCAMGAGIAVEFNRRFKGMKDYILGYTSKYEIKFPTVMVWNTPDEDRIVFNLITKLNYWNKPTYKQITHCIVEMKNICRLRKVKYLAMPKIGCGLDRLKWEKVREIIEETFKDLDIEIVVCYL